LSICFPSLEETLPGSIKNIVLSVSYAVSFDFVHWKVYINESKQTTNKLSWIFALNVPSSNLVQSSDTNLFPICYLSVIHIYFLIRLETIFAI
jgi:hypothetical protein